MTLLKKMPSGIAILFLWVLSGFKEAMQVDRSDKNIQQKIKDI